MLALKFLHIASMVIGIAFSIGGGWFLERIAATHNLSAIRSAFGAYKPIPILINGFLGAGVLLGLIAAYLGLFNFFAPWLIASYIIFIILSVLGGAVTGKWAAAVGNKVMHTSGDVLSPELQRVLDDPLPRRVFWVNVIGILIVIFLMVYKPGGI